MFASDSTSPRLFAQKMYKLVKLQSPRLLDIEPPDLLRDQSFWHGPTDHLQTGRDLVH